MNISDQAEHRVSIYTDGACSGNPGPGGWAAVLFWRDTKKEISGFAEETTNQRMELMAAIRGLAALKKPCGVDLFSDSAYLINAFQKKWLMAWQRNGWKNSKKEPVANQDLWEELLELAGVHAVVWHKVRGHADNVHNNRCDELARAEIKAAL
ncbi:MAG: ribonuclease HI [Peptococcaceae bacterium]|nr:ribonuclease HI [Peptococcaceae bacterium]